MTAKEARNIVEWDGKAIPVEKWGKDHWSTFMYIETRCVDHDGKSDAAHMRSEPGRPRRGHFRSRQVADGEMGGRQCLTRLNDKTEISGHDDWDCAGDMEDAGLLEWNGTGLAPVFALTDLGWKIAGLLRRHRAEGKPVSSFVPPKA